MPAHKKILIILGHPAKERQSFCESLALAYKEHAVQSGHDVKFIKIADLKFDPILHEGHMGELPPDSEIVAVQERMAWADHWVIVYPLWQFMIPALLKGFFERTLTRGFAYNFDGRSPLHKNALRGKSVRIIQTMGMPALMYRCIAREHGAKALKNMLNFCGIGPVRMTYCGMAEDQNTKRKNRYIAKAGALGKSGQ